jgi:hypothetical protein
LGQKQTFSPFIAMSALPPKADIVGRTGDVRFVPEADIKTSATLVPRCWLDRLIGRLPGSLHFEDQILARADHQQPLSRSAFAPIAV